MFHILFSRFPKDPHNLFHLLWRQHPPRSRPAVLVQESEQDGIADDPLFQAPGSHFGRDIRAILPSQPPERGPIVVESTTNDSEITFKIQILTSSRPLSKNDKRLKGLKDVDYYKENGLYKYTYGASSDYNKVLRTRRNTVTPLFKDAFIIAFRNGEKMNINEAIANFKKRRNK